MRAQTTRIQQGTSTATLRLYGVVFLIVVALLLGLSVAVYEKVFTPVVMVTLQADHVGNQLAPPADVKLRGILVGEVRKVSTDGHGARVELALDPDSVGLIPENVQARLLPKTLFGEKFVDLVIPAHPSSRSLHAGDVIPQDRTKTALELEKVFDDLLPLLRTLDPPKLNATLGALATALEGRGDELGENLVRVDRYLARFNPQLPTLDADISRLADVASTYADAAPDLLRMVRDLSVTSRTVVEKQQAISTLLEGTAGLADSTRDLVATNSDRIVRVASTARPTLSLLATYAPEFPCFLQGLANWSPRAEEIFANNRLHITLEVVTPRPAYQPDEKLQYVAHDGPSCRGLPNPPVPDPGYDVADGSHGNVPGQRVSRGTTANSGRVLPSALVDGSTIGATGDAAEKALLDRVVAPVTDSAPGSLGDLPTLLFGPMARGTVVDLR